MHTSTLTGNKECLKLAVYALSIERRVKTRRPADDVDMSTAKIAKLYNALCVSFLQLIILTATHCAHHNQTQCRSYHCLSNALHSSIGQNIKSHTVSGVRSPARVWKTSNGHNSATRHPIDFVFGSRLGFLARIALINLTDHELHELYYDRPTS